MVEKKHETGEVGNVQEILYNTRNEALFVNAMITTPEDEAHDERVRERAGRPLSITTNASEIRKKLFTEPYGEYQSFHVAMDTSEEALEEFLSNLNKLRQERTAEEIHEMLLIAAETDYQVSYYMTSQMKTGETIADLKKPDRERFKSFSEAMRDFKAFGDFIRKWYFMQINQQFKEEGHSELMQALLIEAAGSTIENAEFFLGKRPILGDQPEYDLQEEVGQETYDGIIGVAQAKLST